ncbi:AEC family transporter [Veronia pacifica]|uniref:Transporter n=1 Tax=Veronia pacifica TaxID=1080227 RepID=A0A1C3EKU8_9GAMM|nr:AEC family transporter [Veronia pacifica]ODA33854.1 hypothetical protein A8L45_08480 [Veronia pacifica]
MQIFLSIIPVFLVSLFGYMIASSGKLNKNDIQSLSKFTFSFAIPVMLFFKMATLDIPKNIEWSLLLSYYLAVLCVFVVMTCLMKYFFSEDPEEQSIGGFSSTFSNAVVVGIPVVDQTLGHQAMLPLLMLISIHALTLYSMGFIFAERDKFEATRILTSVANIFTEMVKNPITLSIFSGLVINSLSIDLPAVIASSLELMAGAAIPLTLFALGASIHQFSLSLKNRLPIIVVVMKNLVLPALVYIFSFHIFNISSLWATTAVIMAAMPVGVNAYIFSQRYQKCIPDVAGAILLSTLTSIFTVTAILTIINK